MRDRIRRDGLFLCICSSTKVRHFFEAVVYKIDISLDIIGIYLLVSEQYTAGGKLVAGGDITPQPEERSAKRLGGGTREGSEDEWGSVLRKDIVLW